MTEYTRWLGENLSDPDLTEELRSIEGNADEINDRFYQNLAFGTGGLRGVIGAGTNRINVYTVGKATQGLADYLIAHSGGKKLSVAIAHDSRNKGGLFARQSAMILAANGIHAYLYSELMPTPALSFAVRYLKCDAGICVTASHNPAKYNGYKAYGSDGCQITADMADGVMEAMDKLDIFSDLKTMDFEDGQKSGLISFIEDSVVDAFIDAVYNESLKKNASNLSVVYTPLNGSGKRCVLRIFEKLGIENVTVVPEQSMPDGNFPTCPYPNPEFREALDLGLKLCEKVKPDLLLATDPDCDRVGIAVRQNDDYVLLSGNEVGILMLDYIAKILTETGKMPVSPTVVTTIVSTDMVDPIAADFGIEVRRVLTGFKYIGDVIAELEEAGHPESYILGFEESYGYLSGGYVRDKDAVNGSMLICEMASYYKEKGLSLMEAMESLYSKYGFYLNETLNFAFEGQDGMVAMENIMNTLRKNPPETIAGYGILERSDYLNSKGVCGGKPFDISLPVSNVLEYRLDGGYKFTVRPSGTEPKIKIYLSAKGETREASKQIIGKLGAAAEDLVN